jgi:ABC-type multidrug transport system fused ATPase/permease subunit
VNHQYVNNQYVNQAYPPAPHTKNKTAVKAALIGALQIVSVGLAAVLLLTLHFPDILKISVLGAILVVDILASVLVGMLMFKPKAAFVQYNVNFQPELEGGATELLDDIFTPSLILSGIKTPQRVEIVINKPEFTIGKNSDSVDGVIQFNQAISRVHCKFVCVENRYFLVDIGSSNGTFVNGARVAVNSQVPVKAGDRIKLANSEFVLRAI